LLAASSLMPARLLTFPRTGASFTETTTMEAVSAAVEKAALPPLLAVEALLPAVPLLWSQAL